MRFAHFPARGLPSLWWFGCVTAAAAMFASAAPARAQAVVAGCTVDFRQDANDDPDIGHAHWINSILQQGNARYYEGMSVPQRVLFLDVAALSSGQVAVAPVHTLDFSHQATKGANIHAYDFLTSWSQAVAAANLIAPGQGLLNFLVAEACDPEIGPPASMATDCTNLRAGAFTCVATLPDDMDSFGLPAGDTVNDKIAAYESTFSDRTVKLYGDAAIASCSVTFNGYAGGSDLDALYTLTWDSASDKILIEMAGHLSVGPDNGGGPGIGYGTGRGAASISGGPYHFKLDNTDFCNPGSQDNQIKGADIILPCCPAGATDPGGKCDDGKSCTVDSCAELNAPACCANTPDHGNCADDGNPCTIETCDPTNPNANPTTGCVSLPAPLSTSCEADGNLCTIDHCNGSGQCVLDHNVTCPGSTGTCDAGQACNPSTGFCEDLADPPLSTPCENDGNLCTVEHCNGVGSCVFLQNVTCQAPVPPCEGGSTCNPSNGQCVPNADAPLSTPCEADNDLCTRDHCNGSGQCVFLSDVTCPGPVPPCEGGQYCEPSSGTCLDNPDAPLSTPCETDGNLCTRDHCDGNGSCVFLSDVMCDPAEPPCEAGSTCNPSTGMCEDNPDAVLSTPCDRDNNLCTRDHCNGSGLCVFLSEVNCPGGTGDCEAGQRCNPGSGLCENLPDAPFSTPCEEDGNLCTIEHCDGLGSCVFLSNMTCDPPVPPCEGGERCEPSTGACVDNPDAPLSTTCQADADQCTIDHCDGNGFCVTFDFVFCPGPVPPCEGGQHCEPSSGVCVPDPDAPLSTPCEADGNLCTRDHCDGSGLCVLLSNVVCTAPTPCDGGSTCNPSTGMCEDQPDDPLSTPCEADGNLCTRDHCNGVGQCVFLSDVICPGPTGTCDGGQNCVPSTGMCANKPDPPSSTTCESDNNPCTADHCDGNGNCVHTNVADGTPCGNPSNTACDNPDTCLAGVCVPNTEPAGTVCRMSAGNCDVQEVCDGTNPNCPPDGFLPGGTQCRNANGVCDVAEFCTGSSAACPPDGFVPAQPPTQCRAAAGPCDVAEFCNGQSPNCPPDVLVPAQPPTICRPANGVCDVPEACNGTSPACPPDVFAPNTTVCRSASGECDVQENCTGTSGACPPDGVKPPGTTCDDDGNRCTNDQCDGSSKDCTHPENGLCGACCLKDGSGECRSFVYREECPHAELKFFLGRTCSQINCSEDARIPTLSEWGMIVLALLMLAGAKVYFGRGPAAEKVRA